MDPTDPIDAAYARDLELRQQASSNGHRHFPIDWEASWNRDYSMDWLADGLWPLGKHLHLFAAAKSGKSLLMLWIGASIAVGRDPFTGAAIPARIVAYIDREMTEQDVIERLQDMGFEWEQLANLRYYLFPTIDALDTNEGGKQLMELVAESSAEVVMLDTLSRVVKGEENSNDTYRNFHLYTGSRLKAAGISMARLDHEGIVSGRSRGATAKVDDVDLVYQLAPTDGGIRLKKTAARVSFTRDEIMLVKSDDPLSFANTGEVMWPDGVKAKANEMDKAGCPIDVSKRQAIALLKEHGFMQGKGTVVLAAIRYRKWRLPLL